MFKKVTRTRFAPNILFSRTDNNSSSSSATVIATATATTASGRYFFFWIEASLFVGSEHLHVPIASKFPYEFTATRLQHIIAPHHSSPALFSCYFPVYFFVAPENIVYPFATIFHCKHAIFETISEKNHVHLFYTSPYTMKDC